MKTIITESLTKSYTYSDYKSKVSDLLAENKSSGNLQNDEMVHYSKINLQRMKRLDKTVVIVDKVKEIVEQNVYNLLFLVISEGWCGDAAQTLPVINKIVENFIFSISASAIFKSASFFVLVSREQRTAFALFASSRIKDVDFIKISP